MSSSVDSSSDNYYPGHGVATDDPKANNVSSNNASSNYTMSDHTQATNSGGNNSNSERADRWVSEH